MSAVGRGTRHGAIAASPTSAVSAGAASPLADIMGWMGVQCASAPHSQLFCVLQGNMLLMHLDYQLGAPVLTLCLAACAALHCEDESEADDVMFAVSTLHGAFHFWAPKRGAANAERWVAHLRASMAKSGVKQSPPPKRKKMCKSPRPAALSSCAPCPSPRPSPRRLGGGLSAISGTGQLALGSQMPSSSTHVPEGTSGNLESIEKEALQASTVSFLPPCWVSDEEVDTCQSCSQSFGFFVRRHHCRRCGGVFCGKCSDRSIELPMLGLGDKVCTHSNAAMPCACRQPNGDWLCSSDEGVLVAPGPAAGL